MVILTFEHVAEALIFGVRGEGGMGTASASPLEKLSCLGKNEFVTRARMIARWVTILLQLAKYSKTERSW